MNATPESVETPWLTLREAMARTKLSAWLIQNAAKAGELKGNGGGHGRPWRFHIDDLDAWMQQRGER